MLPPRQQRLVNSQLCCILVHRRVGLPLVSFDASLSNPRYLDVRNRLAELAGFSPDFVSDSSWRAATCILELPRLVPPTATAVVVLVHADRVVSVAVGDTGNFELPSVLILDGEWLMETAMDGLELTFGLRLRVSGVRFSGYRDEGTTLCACYVGFSLTDDLLSLVDGGCIRSGSTSLSLQEFDSLTPVDRARASWALASPDCRAPLSFVLPRLAASTSETSAASPKGSMDSSSESNRGLASDLTLQTSLLPATPDLSNSPVSAWLDLKPVLHRLSTLSGFCYVWSCRPKSLPHQGGPSVKPLETDCNQSWGDQPSSTWYHCECDSLVPLSVGCLDVPPTYALCRRARCVAQGWCAVHSTVIYDPSSTILHFGDEVERLEAVSLFHYRLAHVREAACHASSQELLRMELAAASIVDAPSEQ